MEDLRDVRICNRCATSLANDDWTWIDDLGMSDVEASDELARLHAFAEMILPDHPITPMRDSGQTWECWVCEGIEYGGGHVGRMVRP